MAANSIGVIGAGIMGSGIAQLAASKGLNVILVDVNDSAVKKGIDGVNERLARLVSKGKVTTSDKETALGSVAYDDLKPAEIVIEAATEDFNVKAKILTQIDQIIDPNAIIASKTSSLSITKLVQLYHARSASSGFEVLADNYQPTLPMTCEVFQTR